MTASENGQKGVNANEGRRVIITVAGGGFFWQSKSLAKNLEGSFEFHYATPDDVSDHENKGLPRGTFHHVSRITTQADRSCRSKLVNTLVSFRDSYRLIRHVQPHAVICVASPIAIPICFWAKILGKKTIFVESITRVRSRSVTGKILSAFRLCDRFYVQWPEAVELYKGSRYCGTVL